MGAATKTVATKAVKRRVLRRKAKNVAFAAEVQARSAKSHRALNAIESRLVSKRLDARQSKSDYFVEPEAKVAFVIRTRGICDMPPKEKKILRLLRLRQIHNGVFVRLTTAMRLMLQRVNPYIAWGYPSVPTIRKLLLKRGYAKVRNQRVRIAANSIIARSLKSKNILCVEDLVYQIATAGPQFRNAAAFLWPFKLSAPRGGLRAKRKHFCEGGDYGNREEYINKLVLRML